MLRRTYRLLCTSEGPADGPELEGSLVDVPDAVARHRYAITRLADAAGIHKRGAGESERVHSVIVGDLAVREAEYARHVRVAVKAQLAAQQLEVSVRDRTVEDVFVNVIARAGVDQQDVLLGVAVRQIAQPLETFWADHVDRPAH